MLKSPQLLSIAAVLIFLGMMYLYVREFAVLSNTIGVGRLVAVSMTATAVLAASAIWHWRQRFTPWNRHLPEVFLMLLPGLLFAPLMGSLLNRSVGRDSHESFEFVSETAYYASGYGILKGEKLKPTGWRLSVQEAGKERRFTYKKQAYYPLTKPGEKVLLPIRKGLLGFRVMTLR